MMKFILLLITFVFVSSAIACDQLELSKAIASNYQSLIDEQVPGKNFSRVQINYRYPLTNNIPQTNPILVTIPVFLLSGVKIESPSKMEDCTENEDSLACYLATNAFNWYEQSQPAKGHFYITIQLKTSIREFFVSCDNDRME